eukprot:scaffold64942_cov39-Prasinocladus_malaysianus.AAC.1
MKAMYGLGPYYFVIHAMTMMPTPDALRAHIIWAFSWQMHVPPAMLSNAPFSYPVTIQKTYPIQMDRNPRQWKGARGALFLKTNLFYRT